MLSASGGCSGRMVSWWGLTGAVRAPPVMTASLVNLCAGFSVSGKGTPPMNRRKRLAPRSQCLSVWPVRPSKRLSSSTSLHDSDWPIDEP